MKKSARNKLREYFIANVGKKITTAKLRKITGISEYARRIRELRDEEGWDIQSHHDRKDLKSNEYRLVSLNQRQVLNREMPPEKRARILDRDNHTCTFCHAKEGDPSRINRRKVHLEVDHIIPLSQGGTHEDANLRSICMDCHKQRDIDQKSITRNARDLIQAIRRASVAVQREIFEFLKKKFELR